MLPPIENSRSLAAEVQIIFQICFFDVNNLQAETVFQSMLTFILYIARLNFSEKIAEKSNDHLL